MRSGRFRAWRGAIACACVLTFGAPIALADDGRTPVAAGNEIVAPPDAVVVAVDEAVVAPPADESVDDKVAAPPADEVVAAPSADEVIAPPAPEEVVAPADEVVPDEVVAAGDADARPPRGAVVARPEPREVVARVVAQPTPTPTVVPTPPPRPTPVPADDPSCVFPQAHPELPEVCAVLQSDCSLLGTPGDDVLIGDATAELICGLGGDDEIDGGDGLDVLLGGDGDDRLTGGPGADCLLGQGGDGDEFPDATDEDAVIPDYETGEFDDDGVAPTVDAVGVGRCDRGASEISGGGGGGFGGGSGSLRGTVDSAEVVVQLASLLAQTEDGGASPVTLASTADAVDGEVLLSLQCPDEDAGGTVTLFERRADRRVRAGRTAFTCTAPSEVIELDLEDATRERLEDRGRLRLIARVAVDGHRPVETRVTVRDES